MESGKRRHLGTITAPTTTRNAHGQPKQDFNSVGKMRASITPLSGRELFSAQAVESQVTHRIEGKNEGFIIKPSYRFETGARIFNIISAIKINECNREIELMCTEVIE